MAVFTNLYDVSSAIQYILNTQIAPANGVLVTAPPDAIDTTEEIIVSLMWLTEQPYHRNDPPYRNYDGSSEPPPVSLSVFYLITTYGQGPSNNADAAHRLLGQVVATFFTTPVINFTNPLTGPLAGFTPSGTVSGSLEFVLVTMTAELMEKVLLPLQIEHRPFVLYEVGPVQLASPLPAGAPTPVVKPGGVVLTGPTPIARPALSRVVPIVQVDGGTATNGGKLRLDGVFGAPVSSVVVGTTTIPAAGITVVVPGESVNVTLPPDPNGALVGVQPVYVVAGNAQSDPVEILVVSPLPAAPQLPPWVLDGPMVVTHSQSAPLVLTGQGLGTVDMIFVWPDSGIRAPSDVSSFVPSPVTATSITVTLSGLLPADYRIAARVNPGGGAPVEFTPYVVLGITS